MGTMLVSNAKEGNAMNWELIAELILVLVRLVAAGQMD
jgi:hypothetical protein